MSINEPLLRVEGVVKTFGGVRAVDGVTFDIAARSVTALIGPNGAGKSSVFNVISGFERLDDGAVFFDGHLVSGASAESVARRGLVRTFQLPRALASLTVLDNMLVATSRHPGESLRTVLVRRRAARAHERASFEKARILLEEFGLASKAAEYGGTLSGGQRKLLELARALMLGPRMLLLDEPFAGVNRTLRKNLLEHIERLRAERGITFLFVEHDLEVVMRHSDRVIVMASGKIVADGEPDEVRHADEVLDAYLGVVSR